MSVAIGRAVAAPLSRGVDIAGHGDRAPWLQLKRRLRTPKRFVSRRIHEQAPPRDYSWIAFISWRKMHGNFLKLSSQVSLPFIAGLIVLLSVAGCSKKSGMAVVLGKEHIDAREATPEPKAEPSATPSEPASGKNVSTPGEEIVREMREDEVDVDGYVMKKEARGTSRDPRATDHECWIVNVQMVADLRRFSVPTDKLHWEKVKIGDRIKVSYRQGNYTGTVWSTEID